METFLPNTPTEEYLVEIRQHNTPFFPVQWIYQKSSGRLHPQRSG
jgi:hypothetical protein